jgi:site-specific DNA recombinase
MDDTLRVALYARVSSDKQAEELTIRSQLAALKQRIASDGFACDAELCFADEGYSGSTLQRPGLERLRDLAYSGVIDRLYVHSPDRLARNFAHQAVLIEELEKHQVQVVFLNDVAGAASPEAKLLLQMQGMIAEYERAKILERTRRGRRFAARQGKVSALGHAPFGYRYVSKHDGGGEARYEIAEAEARVLQTLFTWVGVEGLSLGEAVDRLRQQGIATPSGKTHWDRSTLREMLRNPAYQGTARFGKTRLQPRKDARRRPGGRPSTILSDRPVTRRRSDHVVTATLPEEQETIPVPALVSAELFQATAERLDENRRRYRQQKRGTEYLLSGLLVCAVCRSACCGRRHRQQVKSRPGRPREYVYYRCLGTDSGRHHGSAICRNASVSASIEETVWSDLKALLQDPDRLRREFEQRLAHPSQESADVQRLEKSIHEQKRRISRLLDAYENGWIDKAEFETRIRAAKERLHREEARLREHQTASMTNESMRLAVHEFTEFAAQMSDHLEQADFATKRKLLRLLINRVEISREEVCIVYKVSLRPFAQTPNSGGVLHDCLTFQSALQAEDGTSFETTAKPQAGHRRLTRSRLAWSRIASRCSCR